MFFLVSKVIWILILQKAARKSCPPIDFQTCNCTDCYRAQKELVKQQQNHDYISSAVNIIKPQSLAIPLISKSQN